jgi:hypothetical protein
MSAAVPGGVQVCQLTRLAALWPRFVSKLGNGTHNTSFQMSPNGQQLVNVSTAYQLQCVCQ